jgi:hypothetical protein
MSLQSRTTTGAFGGCSCVVVTLLVVTAAPIASAQVKPSLPDQAGASEPVARQISLSDYLKGAGRRLHVYFTVERDVPDGEIEVSWPLLQDREGQADIQSKGDLIAFLRQSLPHFHIQPSASNPAVIHLIEKRLTQRPTYALQEEASLTFGGLLGNFPYRLHERTGLRIGVSPLPTLLNSSVVGDGSTTLHFQAKSQPVRDILTNFLPLTCYSRILWVSQNVDVSLDNTAASPRETWIEYRGPRSDRGLRQQLLGSTEARKRAPFTSGELAYALNPNTLEVQDEAIAFTEEQMKLKEPFQVRWAMLFLGKHKVERSIPVLLKYLSYQWTPTPLLEEAHPAVRALILMGETATPAVEEKLLAEAEASALTRLMKIVLGERNTPENQAQARAIIARAKDEAQRKRLRAALEAVLAIPSAWVAEQSQ